MERHLVLSDRDMLWLDEHVGEKRPEGGCALLVRASHGKRRRSLLVVGIVEPEPGDVEVREGPAGIGLYFDTEYLARAQNAAVDAKAGLALVHNHPFDPTPTFSDDDERSERALFGALHPTVPGPLAAVLLGSGAPLRAREWSKPAEGPMVASPIHCVRVVGKHLDMRWTADADLRDPPDEKLDRSIRLWGETGQTILQNLRVGIVGAGGVGGYHAEGLARLGVGSIVQIDYDVIKDVNVPRNAQSTWADLGRKKVEVLQEHLPSFAAADAFEYEGLDARVQDAVVQLLDCDVLLCAVDGYVARDCVNEIAYRHMISVVDCGNQLVSTKDKVRLEYGVLRAQLIGPTRPCLWCTGFLTAERLTKELMPDDAQVAANYGLPLEEAPAVFYSNALTLGMAGMMFLEHVLHVTGHLPDEIRYNVVAWDLSGEEDPVQVVCECQRVYGWGDHDPPRVAEYRRQDNVEEVPQ